MAGTEHYNLFTPSGNETVAYQDFINENNQKIDDALFANHNSAATANENAQTALSGLEAANTNINNLQTEVTGYGIPDMKTEISAQDSRIEALEDTVGNTDIVVVNIINALDSPTFKNAYLKGDLFGLNIITTMGRGSASFDVTPLPGYNTYSTRKNFILARNFINLEGNPLRLEEMNKYYELPFPCSGIFSNNGLTGFDYIAAVYNGTYTSLFANNIAEQSTLFINVLFALKQKTNDV